MLAESHVTIQALLTNFKACLAIHSTTAFFPVINGEQVPDAKVSTIDVVEDGIRTLQSLVTRSTTKGRQKVENA